MSNIMDSLKSLYSRYLSKKGKYNEKEVLKK